jgi:hypothetical protein
MRRLLLGATVVAAVTLAMFVAHGVVRADEPVPPDGDALSELVFAGAPLISDSTAAAAPGSSSGVGTPPIGPAAAPAAVTVPPPNIDPPVNPQLPSIPNPLDVLGLNPKDWAGDILNAILTTIGKALIEAFRGFTDWALGVGDSSLNFVTRTPAAGTYESPTVLSLWNFSLALVNIALAAVVMWGGFNIMVKEHTRSPYHEAMELLPRVILAALAANLTLEFAHALIDGNNAISAAIGQVTLPGYDQATPSQDGIALIFTALAYGIVAILIVFQMLMRLALIDMLIVLAPVAALMWVLPQTQSWFRWWADLFPITVFQQAIQVMVLRLGTALMVELTPGSLSNALLTLMLGIAVCWLTLKVPSLLRSRHSQAGLFNVVTLVAATRAVGAIGGAAAGGGAGAAAGGAAAGGAAAGGTPRQAPAAGRA